MSSVLSSQTSHSETKSVHQLKNILNTLKYTLTQKPFENRLLFFPFSIYVTYLQLLSKIVDAPAAFGSGQALLFAIEFVIFRRALRNMFSE